MDDLVEDLDHALTDIAAIRGHMARVAEFHGYGPTTLLATAALALAAAGAQAVWVPRPLQTPGLYTGLWSATAIICAALIALEAVARGRRQHQGLADAMIFAALEQFLPAAAAGLLLTIVLLRSAPATVVLFPGLWQILFSLGVFATCRILPRPTLVVGGWYGACGLFALAAAGGPGALAPWRMAVPFAVGQSLAAVILHRASASQGEEAE